MYGESYCDGADGHNEEEGEQEVDGAHGYRESADDEVAVAHAYDAELLLQEADDEAQQQSGHHGGGADEHTFGTEGAPQTLLREPHALKGEDVMALVDDKQRQRGHKAEGGDKYDEREYEVDAQSFGAEYLVVERLLVVAVFDGDEFGGKGSQAFLYFGYVGVRGEFEGQGADLVRGVIHQVADEVDVCDDVLPVDVLLDEEVAGRIGVACVEGLVYGKAHRCGATFGNVYGGRHVGVGPHGEGVVDFTAEVE